MTSFVIAERFEVNEGKNLVHFNTSTSKAYEAKDLHQSEHPLIALKTSIFPPPRLDDLDAFMKLGLENAQLKLMHLEYAANTLWTSDGPNCKSVVLFYRRPGGPPLMGSLSDTFKPWTDDQVINIFLIPMVEILTELNRLNKIHRAIRPTNIFFDNTHRHDSIILGECLSVPFGYEQGILFEPIAYAQADPIGRGVSTLSNDLFALGVTMVFLINGRNPCQSMTAQQIMEFRIEHGTFSTYCPKLKASTKLHEVLRGLLADVETHRWTLKDLTNWITNGTHPSNTTQPQPIKRARRPFIFNNRTDILTTNLLAQEIRQNPSQALDLIGKTELLMWIKNSLADTQRIHKFEDLKAIIPKSATASERLLGILQVLDPGSPFYWQGRSAMGQGLGMYFAKAICENDRVDSLSTLLISPVLFYYLSDSLFIDDDTDKDKLEADSPINKFQVIKALLAHKEISGGVERCAYFMCPTLPCLSPYIKSFNCLKITDVLIALDQIGSQPQRPDFPLDKHMIAFILTREKNLHQRLFLGLDAKSSRKRLVAMFKLLAELQQRHRIAKLPGLCKWFMDLSEPVINSYKNLKWREHLNKKLLEITNSGNLMSMIRLLDNKKALEGDYIGLQEALREVQYLENSVKGIIATLSNSKHYGERLGQTNAMFLSSLLGLTFTGGYFLIKVMP